MKTGITTIALISLLMFAAVFIMQSSFVAGLFVLVMAFLRGLYFLDQGE